MKVSIQRTVSVTEEIEIEFPAYFDDGDSTQHNSWDAVHKLEEDGTCWTVKKTTDYRSDQQEFEFRKSKIVLSTQFQRLFGSSVRTSEAAYEELLAETRDALDEFPRRR